MISPVLFPFDVSRHLSQHDLTTYAQRFLAVGDSWFDPAYGLLEALSFDRTTGIVTDNTSARYTLDINRNAHFRHLLFGKQSLPWTGVFLSVGGNDLLEAVQVPPAGRALNQPALRLLRKQDEWGDVSEGATRYLSAPGWQTFERYLRANLHDIFQLLHHPDSLSKKVPVFIHTYAVPTPRHASAMSNHGPWLYPAVKAYGIPITDWIGVAEALFGQLASLLTSIALEEKKYDNNIHVVDSFNLAALERAGLSETGLSGDWLDEVHLAPSGQKKLAELWSQTVNKTLAGAYLADT